MGFFCNIVFAKTLCVPVVIPDAGHDFGSIVVSNFGRLRLGIVTDSFFVFKKKRSRLYWL